MMRSSFRLFNKANKGWINNYVVLASTKGFFFPSKDNYNNKILPFSHQTNIYNSFNYSFFPKYFSLRKFTSDTKKVKSDKDKVLNSMDKKVYNPGADMKTDAMNINNNQGKDLKTKVLTFFKLWKSLIRLQRPTGIFMVFLPTTWGSGLAVTQAIVQHGADPIALCAPFAPIHLLLYFFIGAFTMRCAGCIINDMWDRDLDCKVERTKDRPLACNALSMKQGTFILAVHLSVAAAMLTNLPLPAIEASLVALPLAVLYPLAKRFMPIPSIALGITETLGIFVAYATIMNGFDFVILVPLYLAAISWNVILDGVYGFQDLPDDLKIGVKSTAQLCGDSKVPLYAALVSTAFFLFVAGYYAHQSFPYYLGILACVSYLFNAVKKVDLHDPNSCFKGFIRNAYFGGFVFLAMAAGNAYWAYVYAYDNETKKYVKDGLEKDTQITENNKKSTLSKILSMNNTCAQRAYDPFEFSWLDRYLRPAFVQSQAIEKERKEKGVKAEDQEPI